MSVCLKVKNITDANISFKVGEKSLSVFTDKDCKKTLSEADKISIGSNDSVFIKIDKKLNTPFEFMETKEYKTCPRTYLGSHRTETPKLLKISSNSCTYANYTST